MISYGRKKGGLNRTKFDNKSVSQIRRIFEKHYETLGKKAPKSVSEGRLTPSSIKKIKQTLLNMYDKSIKKEKKIIKEYRDIRTKYNIRVDIVTEKALEGRTELEKKYLKGEEIQIPHLFINSTHADKSTYRKIGNEEFATLQDMQNRSRQLKQQFKKLLNLTDSDFFHTSYNLKTIMFMVEAFQYYNELSQAHISLLWQELSVLSQFELEMFVKLHLNTLIERYLGVDTQTNSINDIELSDTKSIEGIGEHIYSHITQGITSIKNANSK